MRYQTTVPPCPCGSGAARSECVDGYGCFMFFYCAQCYGEKRMKYRDDIFEQYPTDEPIEPED